MKLKILTLILFLTISKIFATEQEADILIYNKTNLTLSTGWGHPSPLETYYLQKRVKYPFVMLSTANYRGFVAHWSIENSKLYLTNIQIEDSTFSPAKYIPIVEKNGPKIFADWFSGIIECEKRNDNNYWEVEASYYFHIRYGEIIDTQIITKEEMEKIINLTEIDPEDKELVNKYKMLILNQNYITYYFRLTEDEKIILGDIECNLVANTKNLSPILSYYNNDHLNWKYNWENLDKSGAPNCKWLVKDSNLFLQEVNLFSGLEFDSITVEKIDLDSLFSEKASNNSIFANWVSGVYLVKHGYEKEDEMFPSIKEFKTTEYTFLNITNGIVIEKYNLPGDFNFSELPNSLEPKLRAILETYFN